MLSISIIIRLKAMAAMAASGARAIWKGSISFGLVNIPIQVFSATQKEEYTSFNQLCDKGHKIKYKKWCPVEEREVQWSEIKKGYEISKNTYVVLEKEDLEGIKLFFPLHSGHSFGGFSLAAPMIHQQLSHWYCVQQNSAQLKRISLFCFSLNLLT
jgi:hypothetical protein